MRPNYYRRKIIINWGLSWRWIFRIILVVALYFSYLEVQKKIREVKSKKAAQEQVAIAKNYVGQNKVYLAIDTLRKALGFSPKYVPAMRLLAQILDGLDDKRCLEYYRLVVFSNAILPGEIEYATGGGNLDAFFGGDSNYELKGSNFDFAQNAEINPQADADDLLKLIQAAIKFKECNLANFAAKIAADRFHKPALPYSVSAQIKEIEGDKRAQEIALRNAVEIEESKSTLIALARFLISNDIARRKSAEICDILQKVSTMGGDESRDALILGLNADLVPAENKAEWLQKFRNHPSADLKSLLLADQYEITAMPNSRSAILKAVLKRSGKLSLPDKVLVGDWLFKQSEPKMALELIPLKEAITSKISFLLWMRAARQVGYWKEIIGALQGTQNPLPYFEGIPYLTEALQKVGENEKSLSAYQEAIQKASKQPTELQAILEGFIMTNQWPLFLANANRILDNTKVARVGLDRFDALTAKYRNTVNRFELYDLALKSPVLCDDQEVIQKLQFLKLVLGKPVEADALKSALIKNPGDLQCRLNLVLAYLKQGKKAKAIYEFISPDNKIELGLFEPSQKIVAVAVLAADSRRNEALQLAATINREMISTQEEALLKSFLIQ